MILRVTSLMGTASPSPTPATAVLMPTTHPCPSASAPPEFPGLRAASVWITFSTMRPAARERTGSDRPSAETTPAVTDPANPLGFPIATTSWPTRSASASPSVAGARSAVSERSTARSESGSAPTTSALNSRPSTKDASYLAVRAGHHVRGGEHEAVGRDHDAAAAADGPAATPHPPRDAEVRDGRREPLGDGDNCPRVGVERLVLGDFFRGNERKIGHPVTLPDTHRSTEEGNGGGRDHSRRGGADDRPEPARQAERLRRGDP